jgi:hypothetical protein
VLSDGHCVKLNLEPWIVTLGFATNPASTLPLIVGNCRSTPSLNTLFLSSKT